MREFFRNPMTKIRENALCVLFFGGVSALMATGLTLLGFDISRVAQALTRRSEQLYNNTLLLTPNSTQFTTLNNTQPTTNVTVQTTNIAETCT